MLAMNRILHLLILAAGLFFLFSSCAKQGYPSGGPKDETPPVVLGTMPSNGTLHFDAKEFVITFDEYVTLKDQSGVIVSPTMAKKPEFGTKGHGLVVKIKDTLQPATTYLFQFKNAIADFNEGNLLPSFEYVFSTGSTIDSMTLRGNVVDAFSLKPQGEGITVMAWAESQMADTLGDSIVCKVQPLYVTYPDKEGRFELNHLREGRYLLMAIADGDKNLRLGTAESVAFLDTLTTAWKMPVAPDTAHRDTTAIDSTRQDTTRRAAATLASTTDTSAAADSLTHTPEPSLLLRLSESKKKEVQRIQGSAFLSKGRIEIVAALPLSASYTLRPVHADSSAALPLIYHQRGTKGDTLNVWLADSDCDSIRLLLTDTTGLNDTLVLRNKGSRSPAGPSLLSKKLPSSFFRSTAKAQHPYFDTLWLTFANPVAGYGSAWLAPDSLLPSPADTAVLVLTLSDSTYSRCAARLCRDSSTASAVGFRAFIAFDGKPGAKYQFTLPQGLFVDIWGNPSDSITITTEYTKTENYGNLFLTLLADTAAADTLCPFPRLVVQLLNEKGDILAERLSDHPGKLSFLHLKGGKYSFRAIIDTDGNHVWTPGNWWLHRQPEEVILFDKTLDLRENWDMEERWTIPSATAVASPLTR